MIRLQPLPYEHPNYWFREGCLAFDDGYPGAAAYAWAQHAKQIGNTPILWEMRGHAMAKQLGYGQDDS